MHTQPLYSWNIVIDTFVKYFYFVVTWNTECMLNHEQFKALALIIKFQPMKLLYSLNFCNLNGLQ